MKRLMENRQWERVQELRKNKRRPAKTGRISMFSGLLYCADCGAKLYFCTCKSYKDDSQNHFVCSNYKSNTGSCKILYPGTGALPGRAGNHPADIELCPYVPEGFQAGNAGAG